MEDNKIVMENSEKSGKYDFQDFLNNELLTMKSEKSINRYYDTLVNALEEKNKKNEKKSLQYQFEEAVEGNEPERAIEEPKKKDEKIEGEDDLIVGSQVEEKEENAEELGEEEFVDISDEELDEKYPEDDLNKNQKRYAYRYEKVMEQYYKLKLSLEKNNIRKGGIAYDDKNFGYLMQLKTVATNYEIYFRNASHGVYHSVADGIESVRRMQEEYEIEIDKYQDENNRMHENLNIRVEDLVSQINNCLEKLQQLSDELEKAEPSEKSIILTQISEVQDMYIKLNKKLEQIRPNPKQLAEEEERSKNQNDKMDREFGYYDKMNRRKSDDKDNILLTTRYISKEDARNDKEDKLDEIGTSSSLDDAKEKIGEAKEEMLETAGKEIDKGNLEVASEITEKYTEMYSNDFDDSDKKKVEEVEKLKEEIDKAIQSNAEYSDRTYSADERARNDATDPEILDQIASLARGEKVGIKEDRVRDNGESRRIG